MSILTLALVLALQDEPFKYSEWEAWVGFAVGSSVTMTVETDGMKMKMTTTLKSKSESELTLDQSVEMNGSTFPAGERTIAKQAVSATDAAGACPSCKKKHWGDPKQSKEKLKIGEKELEATLVDIEVTSCDGNTRTTSRMWYSKEVPGWVVRMDAQTGKSSAKQTCIAYAAKK
jgi:hypothetical protein